MAAQRAGFGGLGALFFLASLGSIAIYVQSQTIPNDRDLLRKPATALPEIETETVGKVMAWEDRVDLAQLELVEFSTASPPSADPTTRNTGDHPTTEVAAPMPASEPSSSPKPDLRPEDGRYVQDLLDGHRLLYSIDPVLQQSALTIFRNREVPYAGAVVLDLRDNSVLVMAGHSTMDPQVDPLEVVTTAWAPAASTFKLITATSLLENKAATPTTKTCFHGGLTGISDLLLKDNASLDTRCETLATAIARSHNVVIGKLALKNLDEDQLNRTAHAMQFGVEIPFEFPIEPSPAHIPSEDYARAKVAAGFWHVDLSPMHGALVASIFARKGIYQPPHVIDHVIDPTGNDITPARPKSTRVIAELVAKDIGAMMVRTTTEGTARKSFRDDHGTPYLQDIRVAGKTGSLTGKREPYLNYNWFLGFAPAENPEIAFAVVIANEPTWRIKAHYAARRLVQIYMSRRDAIADQRSARVTATALILQKRDAETGVVVAAKHRSAARTQKNADESLRKVRRDSGANDVLPPPPGPLPQVGE